MRIGRRCHGHQAETVEAQPGFSRKLTAVVHEKKVSLYERALKANPRNEVRPSW